MNIDQSKYHLIVWDSGSEDKPMKASPIEILECVIEALEVDDFQWSSGEGFVLCWVMDDCDFYEAVIGVLYSVWWNVELEEQSSKMLEAVLSLDYNDGWDPWIEKLSELVTELKASASAQLDQAFPQ